MIVNREKRAKEKGMGRGKKGGLPHYTLSSKGLIKIQIDSFFEAFFFQFGLCSFIFFFGLLIAVLVDDSYRNPLYISILGICLATNIICRIGAKNVDDYYIADTRNRVFLYHRNWFGYENISEVAEFDAILAISISCRKRTSEDEISWEYQIVLATNNGKVINISDYYNDRFSELTERAEDLCGKLGISFLPGHEEKALFLEREKEGNYYAEFREPGFFNLSLT
ncbi:hypothetical protein ACFL35_01180 [Candidatus Riflebacteria bacterium]